MEVKYSINGILFKTYGVNVSHSEGLYDALQRKEPNSYDWAEYHGISVDLSNPRFEPREIELHCWVKGANVDAMFTNFRTLILAQFQKAGTQRLMVQPTGFSPLVYEVYMEDGIKLEKVFRSGIMVGLFKIKLIEPNPIKKVYLFKNTFLNLSYTSPQETEIFFGDGTKSIVPGNASIVNKELPSGDKYIIIAGNVDQITNIVTNATLVWDKL